MTPKLYNIDVTGVAQKVCSRIYIEFQQVTMSLLRSNAHKKRRNVRIQ